MYRGQETNHQSGKAILAWSGTCMFGDQGCRSGWHLHVLGNREMDWGSSGELGVDHKRLGLTMEVGVAYS